MQKGRLMYSRADTRADIDTMSNLLSDLIGTPNHQDMDYVSWNSLKNPAENLPIPCAYARDSIDIGKCLALSNQFIEELQLDQVAVLVNCTLTRVADAQYCIMAFGLKVDDLLVYGPSEQMLSIVTKDESMSATQEHIIIILDENGICQFNAENLLKRCSALNAEPMMTYDSALLFLSNILAHDAETMYTVRQAWLSYLPVGDAFISHVQFRPFWCFFLEYSMDDTLYACTLRVDALTGEVLW